MLYLNNVVLCGRITKDIEIRQTNGGKIFAKFTVAVERENFDRSAEKISDFLTVTVWEKTAEFVGKYFAKGSAIYVEGSIQTGSYTNKEGVTVYTTEVLARRVKFVESKPNSNSPAARNEQPNYYQPQQTSQYQQPQQPSQQNYQQTQQYRPAQQQNSIEVAEFEIIGDANLPFN